jgi:hypothetical protein
MLDKKRYVSPNIIHIAVLPQLALNLLCGVLNRGGDGMSFGMYVLGFIVVIVGLAYGAYLAHVPAQWIGVGVIVLVGLGIVKAVTQTRQKDPN